MTRVAIMVFVAVGSVVAAVSVAAQSPPSNGVVRLDSTLDALISPNAKAELLKGDYWQTSRHDRHAGAVANMAFGDADGKSLYMVGGRSLWRIRVTTPGIRPMTKEKR